MNWDGYNCDGQMSLFDYGKTPLKINKPVRLIELFAGIGSQLMALKELGVEVIPWKAIEFEKYACMSYNAIHGTNIVPTDIRDISGKDLEIENLESYIYIMTYSFPCTDLSVAGKMLGMKKTENTEERTRSGLLWEVERLLNETPNKPQILLMENVTQVHGKNNLEDFEKWCKFLESKGYTNKWCDMNAKDYGVAQNRNRCFMVSWLGNYTYEFPEQIKLTKCMKDYLEEIVGEKYYVNSDRAKQLLDNLEAEGTLDMYC